LNIQSIFLRFCFFFFLSHANPPLTHDNVSALKDAIEAVQNPQDAFIDQMVLVSRLVALRISVKWKVFDAVPATGAITYAELAAKVDSDEELVSTSSLYWYLLLYFVCLLTDSQPCLGPYQ
jgi:hypothetical protein